MKKPAVSQNIRAGCCCLGGIIVIIFGLLIAGRVWQRIQMTHPSETVTLTDLSKAHEFSVRAPIPFFCTGNLRVLYEGALSADATLEIISSNGHRTNSIPLLAGKVGGIYGDEEVWMDDLSVRYVPFGVTRGTLKITAVCGRSLTSEEREWASKLYEQQREKR